jgi:hypothetical protein
MGGFLFMAIGIAALSAIPRWIPESEPGTIGPRYVPTIMAVGLLALSAVLVLREAFAGKGSKASFREVLPSKEALAVAGLIAAWVAAQLLGLGYLLSTIVFVFLCLFLFKVRTRLNYVIAGVFTAGLFALFSFALRVKLP